MGGGGVPEAGNWPWTRVLLESLTEEVLFGSTCSIVVPGMASGAGVLASCWLCVLKQVPQPLCSWISSAVKCG